MAALEHNVDAYHVLGDILTSLRDALRSSLEAQLGQRWFDTALSPELFARLVARKERERAVNGLNDSYFTLLQYADFMDLHEVCRARPEAAGFLKAFGGNLQLGQARFLELQALHDKLAGLRDINEAELSFLQHVVRRLRQYLPPTTGLERDLSQWASSSATRTPTSRPPTDSPLPSPSLPPQPEAARPQPSTVPTAALPAPPAPGPAPAVSAVAAAPVPATSMSGPASQGPPATRTGAVTPAAGRSAPDEDLGHALQTGDDRAVIAALYREVLSLSERIVDSRGPNEPQVWEKISESSWYQRRFAILGMRPVSDFYSLYLSVREKLNEGGSNQELQSYLQDHNYQQVVLAVGVFFHQNMAV